MNKKVILLSDLFNHGINLLLRLVENSPSPTRHRNHYYEKKLPRLNMSKDLVLFVNSRKKLSPAIKEKTRCNTLFESPCIIDECVFLTLERRPEYICTHFDFEC